MLETTAKAGKLTSLKRVIGSPGVIRTPVSGFRVPYP